MLVFLGIIFVVLYHGSVLLGWNINPSFGNISPKAVASIFVLGITLMAGGLLEIARARAVLNGYWGPDIYEYKNPKDNKLITNGIYAHL